MVACLLANLSEGQKKTDVEIYTTQSEAAHLLNVFREAAAGIKDEPLTFQCLKKRYFLVIAISFGILQLRLIFKCHLSLKVMEPHQPERTHSLSRMVGLIQRVIVAHCQRVNTVRAGFLLVIK